MDPIWDWHLSEIPLKHFEWRQWYFLFNAQQNMAMNIINLEFANSSLYNTYVKFHST